MINIKDWIAVIPSEDKRIAYVGEHQSDFRQFFLSDLTYQDYAFYLDLAFDLSTVTRVSPARTIQSTQQKSNETVDPSGSIIDASVNTNKESYTQQDVTVDCEATTDIAPLMKWVTGDGITLTWTILNQHTRLPGVLRATLRAVSPRGNVKKSAMMLFTVSPSVEATPAAPIELSEHEQMEQAMVLALEQAAEDTFTAFEESLESAIGSVEQVREYVDEKTAPATLGATGTVKLGTDLGMTGLGLNPDGELVIAPADKRHINGTVYGPNAPIVVRNLDYAVKYIGDGYYATEEALAEKTAPATDTTYGTVMCATNKDMASITTGIYVNPDGMLTFTPASNGQINVKSPYPCPITPANLDYAVKVGLVANANELADWEKAVVQEWLGVTEKFGDVETALDAILAMQESLIGGDE